MWDVLLALLAVLGLTAFLTLYARLPAALGPLTALSLAGLWLAAWGMAGALAVGGWTLYLACWGLGGWALVRRRESWRQLLTPGLVLFLMMALGVTVYFAVRQPIPTDFDEYSLWATAAKLTKANDALYTVGETGTPWQATQTPSLILMGYFAQFLGRFAYWKVYVGYDWLLFACFAAVLGRLDWKKYALAVPAAVACWCAPWFFTTYNRTIFLSKVYMNSYGDIPAGVLFGGAVALWLALRAADGPRWPVVPVLAFAALAKDNLFPVMLVAAGMAAADWFFFPDAGPFRKGWPRRLGFSALTCAAPLAAYLAWSRYIAGLAALNAAEGGMGVTSQSLPSVVINGVKMLLGLPVADYYEERRWRFVQAGQDMVSAFFKDELSMLGPGVVVLGLIVALLLAGILLAKGARLRARGGVLLAVGLAGFVGYNFVLRLSYAFIFREEQCVGLVDYNRYIYPYYIGLFLIALAWLLAAAQSYPAPQWRGLAAGALVLALGGGMLLRTNQFILPQYSVLGFSQAEFDDQNLIQRKADAVAETVEPGSRIFFVSQGDNGLRWFSYSCDLLPLILDYSGDIDGGGGGGGTFGLPELDNGNLYYHPYTLEEFRTLVEESGCAYILVDAVDEIFVQSYGSLFADGLAGAEDTLLYRVTEDGWQPVEMEVPR